MNAVATGASEGRVSEARARDVLRERERAPGSLAPGSDRERTEEVPRPAACAPERIRIEAQPVDACYEAARFGESQVARTGAQRPAH